MPFDLPQAAVKLRNRHGDAAAFRAALLELLFAAGCGVREQALALPWGDALCLRTAGPAAAVAGPRRVVVAIDLELPSTCSGDAAGRWPVGMQSLGGPSVAIGWLALLHACLQSPRQRPWELIYVRGPALGTAELVADLTALQPGADVAVLVPVAAGPRDALDMVRLELLRPRNIWRFPACDHTVAVDGRAPLGGAWLQLRRVLDALGPAAAWTLHDLSIGAGEGAPYAAVLRSSVAATACDGMRLQPLASDARLLFPVNDALAGLAQLADRLPAKLATALEAPLQATSLPNGLCLHALAPPLDDASALPDTVAALSLQWAVAAVARPHDGPVRLLSVTADEAAGPVPAGIDAHACLWRIAQLDDDAAVRALSRACQAMLAADA